MHDITLKYYDTYSLNVKVMKTENDRFRLCIRKSDNTETKSHDSTVEYYLDRNQLTDVANLIMESLK